VVGNPPGSRGPRRATLYSFIDVEFRKPERFDEVSMSGKSVHMQVVTWNVRRKDADVLDALEKASQRMGELHLVTLQEVRVQVPDSFRDRLVKMGLRHVHYPKRLDVPCQDHINLIASCWPLEAVELRYERKALPQPQALTEVLVKVGGNSIAVTTAHMPNASEFGWDKIKTFRVLKKRVEGAKDRPCIVTGDFNEPRYSILHGRVHTWGQKEGRFEYERWKDDEGRPDGGKKWDEAVRWLFEMEDEPRLRHAYWEARGHPAKAPSHINHGQPRWFDHIFVSRKFFRVKECKYLHELRGPGLSDHSALSARLVLHAGR